MMKRTRLERIEIALKKFYQEISKNHWDGREREVVSLFAFKFLTTIFNPGQIGIEVAVEQVEGSNRKRFVNKDLVIWKEENMTTWWKPGDIPNDNSNDQNNPPNVPLCIMEWKVRGRNQKKGVKTGRTQDIEWLERYTGEKKNRMCIGYSVLLDLNELKKPDSNNYLRIVAGKRDLKEVPMIRKA